MVQRYFPLQYFLALVVHVCSLFFVYCNLYAGNNKGGSITVPFTSCLTGLELAV